MQANANFIQLSASIEEVRASQAAATAKKQQHTAAAQRDKNVTRQQKTAEAKAAATAVVNTLLAKHSVDTVDDLQHANLERLTGRARRGPQVQGGQSGERKRGRKARCCRHFGGRCPCR